MEKYDNAAIRHFFNARLLEKNGDLDNAGHLIGFAVECAIKHKISTLPANAKGPHGHFPDFQNIAIKHLQSRSGYSTSMLGILKKSILVGWCVDRRYYATGNTTQAELDSWFEDAKRVFACANLKVKL